MLADAITRNTVALSTLPGIYVDVAGDTMTGVLTLAGDPTTNLEAATKQYTDALRYGVTDGSNALPGQIGEYFVVNNTAGLALGNQVNANLAQFTLSAGDWDVNAGIYFLASSSEGSDELRGWTNTVSLTQPDGTDGGLAIVSTTSAGLVNNLTTPPMRLNLTASTTVYLSCWANYGTGNMTVKGFMCARRMR